MSFKHWIRLGVAVIAVLWVAPASSMILEWSLDDMAVDSEAVVRGRVLDLQSHWLDGPASIIVTDVTFAIDEVWKGSAALSKTATLELRVNGGQVGEMGMKQEHAPVFAPGEEAVLFLWTTEEGRLGIFNDEQGKYTVFGEQVTSFAQRIHDLASFRSTIQRAIEAGKR